MITEAYPLAWPISWKRTRNPKRSRFEKFNNKPSIDYSTSLILDELRKLTSYRQDIIISTNLKLKNDGLPYSNQREPQDAGVSVYFNMTVDDKKQQMVIACDSFDKIGCNLYACAKTIEAMRGIERWGCSELLQRAFTGFKALNMGSPKREWWEILECAANTNLDHIKACYKMLAKKYYPDMPNGNKNKFQEIQEAYEQAVSTY